jgi:hypothetical protein
MTEKEHGISENAQFPSLWNPTYGSESTIQSVTTILNSE